MPLPFFSKIDVPCVTAMSLSNGVTEAVRMLWNGNEMNVVRHKAIGPYINFVTSTRSRHHGHIFLIIIVAEKSLHPAITPLGDVVRYSRYDDSCYPCHAWIITGIVPNYQVLSILSPEYPEKIDSLGGAIKAIEAGYMQKEISDSAYHYQMDVEKKENIIVGLNQFVIEDKAPTNLLKVNPEVGRIQQEKLEKVKSSRDNTIVNKTLKDLKDAAKGEENLMPIILDAVRNYATLGEIADVFRGVFGEYREA